MFNKILIANRGEIACRVAATARALGVQTVAVYSDADTHAKHVAACDEAVHIGGSAPKDSYLRWERIIEAAQATGAQAIHPGYGFLSENEDFAQACAAAGLVFIGPPAASIRAMGLKAESKRLMEKAGVPLVPGYHGADQDPAPLASCQREARNSFGDDAVLVEKYVQRPRHIEIQVFADQHGHCVYLFERDCSVQRRHQKVLEEAPAPGMTPELRARMGDAAVAAARAVGYVGAGTVEFIVEQPVGYDQPEAMTFYFMEMNTRLQVEHPVTEAITGLDLVEWQLRVASGELLPRQQDELRIHGHAIEARICAENPDKQFLPATGTLAVYRKPRASSFCVAPVRVDDGVREGDAISPYYDSMIAKLIVHGDTREQALARLDAALAQTHIVGLATNVQFLRYVLATDSFRRARLDTALIPREADHLFQQDRLGLPLTVAAAVARTLLDERSAQVPGDPFSRRDGWNSHGQAERVFDFDYGGQHHAARLSYLHDGALRLRVDGSEGLLDFRPLADGTLDLLYAGQRERVQVYVRGEAMHVFARRGASQVLEVDLIAHAGEGASEGGRLTAPMPGKVISFAVKAGDAVRQGQALAVMEAMKMEHTIAAPQDGTVAELLYAPGDQVAEGAELLKLAAA